MSHFLVIANGGLGLALTLPDRGMPEILAFGADVDDVAPVVSRARRVNGLDTPPHSAVLLPTGGAGNFGWPAVAGHRDGRDFLIEFAGWRTTGAAEDVTLHAEDTISKLAISIQLSISADALKSRVILANCGEGVFTIDRCMAGSMLFPEGPAELTNFVGSWGREFQTRREPLTARLWLNESRRGRTSHDRSPSLILSSRESRLAVHLGWSGNHVLAVDTLDDGRRLVHAGELFEPGEVRLGPGDSYESPAVYFALSTAALRARLKSEMTWPGGVAKLRPVTLNTWEGNYFDHKLPALMAQADAAAALGIERFVLDDGWFGRRDDDRRSLGDWAVDPRKYPNGLKPLADHVHGLGMEFGLWFEPEMINPDSDLFRAHPDWAMRASGREPPLSRNQLTLDLTRSEVSDHIFACMDKVLREASVDCIKWDMNRDIAPPTNADGRALTSKQTRAFYELLDRVRAAHPNLEIESCASGGGRVDYGVLSRTHRFWASDCTDALERLEIQRGAREFFPPEIIGAHVSASPNHQTHRKLSLDFRALVALAYHFGVEMDPRTLDESERAQLKQWIDLHKRFRGLLHSDGAFHLEPHDGRYVWGAADKDTVVAIVAQGPQMISEQAAPLRLPRDLVCRGQWRISSCTPTAPEFVAQTAEQQALLGGEVRFSGDTLIAAGLNLPMLRPESGLVLEFRRVSEG
jgi:alpha-galactosidase